MMQECFNKERDHESNRNGSNEREGNHRAITRVSRNCVKLVRTIPFVTGEGSVHITAPVPALGFTEITLKCAQGANDNDTGQEHGKEKDYHAVIHERAYSAPFLVPLGDLLVQNLLIISLPAKHNDHSRLFCVQSK